MSSESAKECVNVKHDWVPIIEGGQTVGLQCLNCPKSVRENMEHSEIYVTGDWEIKNLDKVLHACDLYRGNYKRKDPRF